MYMLSNIWHINVNPAISAVYRELELEVAFRSTHLPTVYHLEWNMILLRQRLRADSFSPKIDYTQSL